VLHVDLYRVADPGEVDYLGLKDDLGPGSLLIVEWPHRADGRLPAADLELLLSLAGQGRRVRVAALSPVGQALLDRLIADGC
jgi:tRNA threonylcarbamoyladenosine biosynthesis protein TsaE